MQFIWANPEAQASQIGGLFVYGQPMFNPGSFTPDDIRVIYNQSGQGQWATVGNPMQGFDSKFVPKEDVEVELAGAITILPTEVTPDIVRRVGIDFLIFTEQNPPEQVVDLTAQSGESQKTTLRWTNPPDEDIHSLRILRREDTYPTAYNDPEATLVKEVREASPNVPLAVEDVGLDDGTEYFYSIFVRDLAMNWQTAVTPGFNAVSATPDSPSQILDFTATTDENDQITLSWTNPNEEALDSVRLVRKVGSYPTDESDGTAVYENSSPEAGGEEEYVDAVGDSQTYYYAVFPKDATDYNSLVTAGRNAAIGIST